MSVGDVVALVLLVMRSDTGGCAVVGSLHRLELENENASSDEEHDTRDLPRRPNSKHSA